MRRPAAPVIAPMQQRWLNLCAGSRVFGRQVPAEGQAPSLHKGSRSPGSAPLSPHCRFAQRSREWNAGERQEAIKQQERFLLNLFSQDTFMKSGGALVSQAVAGVHV